jgi:D-arabinose 1-dehydrogenase-like Zn-dependent alcohol dehydrogenase
MDSNNENEKENYDHELFKHVEKIEDADAVGWVFVNTKKYVLFPYKLPELNPKDIKVNITYSGICLSDSFHPRGVWGHWDFPSCMGHEIMGIVSEVGSDVTEFKKGDRVAVGPQRSCCESCKWCLDKRENLCQNTKEKDTYGKQWGGFSTHIIISENFTFKIPDELDEKLAAPLMCAGITVYNAIVKYAKSGDKIAVLGVGGLGHLAIQYAHKMGYSVTGVDIKEEMFDFMKKLGADDVISFNDDEALEAHSGKFNLVINTLPISNKFETLFRLTGLRGTFVQVGCGNIKDRLPVEPFILITREINFVGSLNGTREEMAKMLEDSCKLQVYPICDHYDFEEFPKAFDKLENGKPFFRCILNVEEFSKKNNLFN